MNTSRCGPALALAIAGLLATSCSEPVPDGSASPALLAWAIEGHRSFEPRVTGGFGHQPCGEPAKTDDLVPEPECPGLPPPGSVGLRRLSEISPRIARESSDRAALHTRGVWHLLWASQEGSLDRAVETLSSVASRVPADPQVLNDLAAALLVRAQRSDRPADLVRALSAASRAVRSENPPLAEARFNLALAAELAGLDQAAELWSSYLELDPTSAWAGEADEHLTRLRSGTRPSSNRFEPDDLLRLAGLGHDRRVESLLRDHKADAQRWLERVAIPEWGAKRAGSTEVPAELLVVATALSRVNGDQMALEAIESLFASAADTAELEEHVVAWAGFSEAISLLEAFEVDAARRRLEEVRHTLARLGNPLWGWAELYLAICEYQSADYSRVLERLERLGPSVPADRFPYLASRLLRVRGLVRTLQGEPAAGIHLFLEAKTTIERASDDEALSNIQTLLAGNYRLLGDTTRAWHHLYRALRLSESSTHRFRRQLLLEESALAATALGEPAAALLFQDEVVRMTAADSDPVTAAQALRGRSTIHLELGDFESARADAVEARQLAATIAEPAVQSTVLGDVLLTQGEAMIATTPGEATRLLAEALEIFEDTDNRVHLARAYNLLGQAHDARGDSERAQTALARAISELESARTSIPPPDLRGTFFDQSRTIFDQAVRQEVRAQRPEAAFEFSERLRARVLLDRAYSLNQGSDRYQVFESQPQPLSAAEVRSRLRKNVSILQYHVADRGMVLWLVERDRLEMRTATIEPDRIERLASRLAAQTPQADGLSASPARELFKLLVAPVADLLEPGRHLVIIPDGILYGVAFAALESRPGRPLVHDFSLSRAESASLYAAGLQQVSEASPAEWRVLAVGALEAGDLHRSLPELSAVRDEVSRISQLYPNSRVLTGRAATKPAFLREVGTASLLHFGGHAVVNRQSPLLSRLLLAPSEEGSSSDSLYGRELVNLDLSQVKLAVLAACSAASGEVSPAEGVASLARLLRLAGARVVLAPLWDVEDRATALLLRRFHDQLVQTTDPATALRTAQLDLAESRDSEFSGPSNWAGFALYGSSYPPEPPGGI